MKINRFDAKRYAELLARCYGTITEPFILK